MEQWQRRVIKKHLIELVGLTSCNTELLTRLFSKEILTDEEIHEIDVATLNPKKKAYKMYGLLVTRTNAYHIFLSACKETWQTGVVSILENGESQHTLLTKTECNVVDPSPIIGNTPVNVLDKSPLLKTRSTKTEEPPIISNFDYDLSEHHNLNVPKSGNVKLSSKAVPKSSFLRVEKIPLPQDSDKQSSNITNVFQFFHSLSQNPLQQITGSCEKCHISKSNAKITTDANANRNSDTLSSLSDKRQLESKTDKSNKHDGDISKLNLNVSQININEPDHQGRTSLHRALADGGSLDVIKNLIDNNADYKMKDKLKEGVLHFAVRGGNKEVISFLLSFKIDINEVDKLRETPLHKVRFTKARDYLGITKLLFQNGANLIVKDQNGDTVAHLLAICENSSSADFKIWVEGVIRSGQGHIFAIRGQFGRTPLQAAMQRLDLDLTTLKWILEYSKVDIDQQDNNGDTLLHLALGFGRSLETIKNLVSLGANVKLKDQMGHEVLHLAIVGGNKEVIAYCVSQDLNINAKNYHKNAPLHYVIFTKPKRYLELTKLLLDNGADLYSKNLVGNTLAHEMATGEGVGREDFKIWVNVMIEIGHAHLFTIRGQYGRTPLHFLMGKRDVDLETIKLIIDSAKLDINQPDNSRDTILHLALIYGRSLDLIKRLVELGADWNRKGREDGSVLHFAVRGSNKEAFLYFKSHGAHVNAKDKYGRVPLHNVRFTRSKDYLGMTKFLLENGANLNAKDMFGRTLDHLMSSNKDISAEEYCVWKVGLIKMGQPVLFQHKFH